MSSVATSPAGRWLPRLRPSSGEAAIAAACAVLVLAIWVLAAERIGFERAETIAGVQAQNESLAIAFEEHTVRSLQAADAFLLRARDEYARSGARMDIGRMLEGSGFDRRFSSDASLVTDGASPLMRAHQKPGGDMLAVGLPVQDERTKRWRLPLTRPLAMGEEGPVALGVLWIAPEYFTAFFGKAGFSVDAVIALAGMDGLIRARRTGAGTTFGMDMRSGSLFPEFSKASTGSLRVVSTIDGRARFISYRKVDVYPLVAILGVPEAGAMASFEERRRNYLLAAALGSLILLAAAVALIALIQRARSAAAIVQANESWFRVLFETNPLPMWVYDLETLRFVDVNQAACVKYGYPREEFLGMSIRDIRPPEDLQSLEENLRATSTRGTHAGVWRHRLRDGAMIEVEIVSQEVLRNGRRSRFVCPIDVTSRLEAQREVDEREAALRRAQAMAALSHVVSGPEGEFLSWSDTLPSLVGLPTARVPGSTKAWLDIVHAEDRERFRLAAIRAAASGRREDVEYRVVRGDGQIVFLRQTIEPIASAGTDAPGRWFSTLQDVTSQKKLEAEILKLNAELERRVKDRTRELEAANKELEAFSYTVSHDLRSPLRTIGGFSELVLEEFSAQLPEEAVRHLRKVTAGAAQMGSLIDDLLAFSHVGKQSLVRSALDMGAIVAAALEEVGGAYHSAHTIEVGTLPAATGDFSLVRQVWINLLSNALKYSALTASPHVEVGSLREDGKDVFYVRDNGAGFDMAHAGKLFGVFERLHSEREFPGTGVGLAIARRIVERHGGRIWADAKPDQGATFYFTLGGGTA